MSHEVYWLIEGKVLYNRNWGAINEAELLATIDDMRAVMDESSHPNIHVLVDNREVTSSPGLGASMKAVRTAPRHPSVGWMVAVQVAHPIIRFTADVLMQLTGQRYRGVQTMPEAITFLKSVDDMVEWQNLPESFKV